MEVLTVSAIFLVAIALAMTVVLAMIADYHHNTMNNLTKSINEQSDVLCMIKDEIKAHNELTKMLSNELHEANVISVQSHLIDDWDKELWQKEFASYLRYIFMPKEMKDAEELKKN